MRSVQTLLGIWITIDSFFNKLFFVSIERYNFHNLYKVFYYYRRNATKDSCLR